MVRPLVQNGKREKTKSAQVKGRKQRITFESRIEAIGSRRGKTLAEMKKMARDREVWKSWRKEPATHKRERKRRIVPIKGHCP
jgi:hypothetical protein